MPHPLASLGIKGIIKTLFSLNTELYGSGTANPSFASLLMVM